MTYARAQTYVTYAWPGGNSGTMHGFHNNSTPRYNEAAAKRAWERTIGFLKKSLA